MTSDMTKHPHWAVTVEASGEEIVRLVTECYGGRERSDADEVVIRTAAIHLLAFIGDRTFDMIECEAFHSGYEAGERDARTPQPAPVTAREAEPVAWAAYDDSLPVDVDLRQDIADQWCADGIEVRPLYAHPPQPSETVARVIDAANMARNRLEMIADAAWRGDGRDLKRSVAGVFSDFDAALRALSSGVASHD